MSEREGGPTLEYDEHGCALCPLCEPNPLWGECEGRPLSVMWEFGVPLRNTSEPLTGERVPVDAVWSGWKVECPAGHVLAVSREDEDAEPFRGSALFTFIAEEDA